MNYILFLIASSVEYFGMFIFMFALFRFRINSRMIVNVLLVSFLMCQVSYFTRLNPEIGEMSTYIQFIVFILVLRIMFRVPLFHSVIMNFAGLGVVIILQGATMLLVGSMLDMSTQELIVDVWIKSAIQVLSAVFSIGIARIIYVMHWGFDFVPTSPRSGVTIKGTNAILLVVMAFVIVLTAGVTYFFMNNLNVVAIMAFVVFLISIPIFLYFSLRKDNEDVI